MTVSEKARNAWGLTAVIACMLAVVGVSLAVFAGVAALYRYNAMYGWGAGIIAVLAFFWVLGYFADWSDF